MKVSASVSGGMDVEDDDAGVRVSFPVYIWTGRTPYSLYSYYAQAWSDVSGGVDKLLDFRDV